MARPTLTTELRRNIMGGTNVIVRDSAGHTINVVSYSSRSCAVRAIRTGAAARVALKYR